jgi:hypothetical protein
MEMYIRSDIEKRYICKEKIEPNGMSAVYTYTSNQSHSNVHQPSFGISSQRASVASYS